MSATGELDAVEVERLTRRGLRLAQFTVAYNVVEGAVAITAGLLAGLVSVVGFGVDSAIESIAGVPGRAACPRGCATARRTSARSGWRSRPWP
ncbi:MAG: hypothetical protein NVV66_08670 [Cellulomonas sp.]|uniref:hypothetical protein n=1 Tax=Cellulomonas sp. TaxID=40001 RepID=UPI00258C181D|nr:hypothetical protein [Cellulomonas sp.]MCR6704754.1 hypothetical protein [Cellulomonas sp.]